MASPVGQYYQYFYKNRVASPESYSVVRPNYFTKNWNIPILISSIGSMEEKLKAIMCGIPLTAGEVLIIIKIMLQTRHPRRMEVVREPTPDKEDGVFSFNILLDTKVTT